MWLVKKSRLASPHIYLKILNISCLILPLEAASRIAFSVNACRRRPGWRTVLRPKGFPTQICTKVVRCFWKRRWITIMKWLHFHWLSVFIACINFSNKHRGGCSKFWQVYFSFITAALAVTEVSQRLSFSPLVFPLFQAKHLPLLP